MRAGDNAICRQWSKHISHSFKAGFCSVPLAIVAGMENVAKVVHPLVLLFPWLDRDESDELAGRFENDSEIVVATGIPGCNALLTSSSAVGHGASYLAESEA